MKQLVGDYIEKLNNAVNDQNLVNYYYLAI
jgi:hypothetical protein